MNCHPGRRRTVSNALDRKEHRSLPNVARVPDGDIHQLIGAAIPASFWERYVSDDTAHMGFATLQASSCENRYPREDGSTYVPTDRKALILPRPAEIIYTSRVIREFEEHDLIVARQPEGYADITRGHTISLTSIRV